MFAEMTLKGRAMVTDNSQGERVLSVVPKIAEISSLRIYKKADSPEKEEEMVAEEMLITAGINVKLEQMIGMLPPREIPLRDPPSPEELSCIGFALGQMELKFRKGYVELSFGYRKQTDVEVDQGLCERFLEYVRRGPQWFLEGAQELLEER